MTRKKSAYVGEWPQVSIWSSQSRCLMQQAMQREHSPTSGPARELRGTVYPCNELKATRIRHRIVEDGLYPTRDINFDPAPAVQPPPQ